MLPFRKSLTTAATGSGSPELLRTFTTIVALLPLIAVSSVTPSWHRAGATGSNRPLRSRIVIRHVRDRLAALAVFMAGSPVLHASLVLTPNSVKQKIGD